MTKYLLGGLCTLALLGATVPITSDAAADWYVSGNIGGMQLNDSDFDETGPGISVDGELDFDTGYGVNGAVGYGLSNFRFEGELSYRQADIDSLTVNSITVGSVVVTGLGNFAVDGDVSSLGFMANGWYDFDTGTDWVPYIGGGVGTAQVTAEISSIASIPVNFDESDWVLAYQVGAGIGYNLNPSTTVQLGYRFFGTGDPEFTSGGATQQAEFSSHNIEIGLRFRF